jgi:ABC-type multidrug transport system ATPase subunit
VIGQLKKEGLSVIISESDLSHSEEMLDVVFVIDRGEIREAA